MKPSELDVESIFRALFLADLEGAGARGLAAHQELFPGHEELVERLHRRLNLGEDPTTSVPRSSIGLDTGIGARVGHYRIEAEIGQGGQAVVFRAMDEKLGRPVALKLLLGAAQRGEAGLRRFRREAEVCSKLDHPGICTVHDTGIQGGIPYIVMELIEGGNLSTWALGRDPSASAEAAPSEFVFSDEDARGDAAGAVAGAGEDPADLPDRHRIAAQIEVFVRCAEALEAAHAAGVIHRDIKPGNIMVKKDGQPVILDFGLAQDLDSDLHALTQTGDFFGTPAYMSPEQISAHRIRLDLRSDIFSLGVSFYECLTRRRPFDAPTREGIYQAILTKEAADPRLINRAVPRDLAVVVGKALEKDRDRRYQTAGELAADLRRILDHEPILARPAGIGLKMLRWTQRNRVLAAALLALPTVILVTLITAGLLARGRDQQRIEDRRRSHRDALAHDVDELTEMLARNDMRLLLQPRVLRRIDEHLAVLGDEGRAFIRARLSAPDDSARIAAVTTLVHLGDAGSVGELVRVCLEDSNEMVRMWSSQALMRMEAKGINEALKRVFRESKDEGCQVNALFGLVFNEQPDADILASDYVHDDAHSLFMRTILAKNLMLLARADMTPVAEWMAANLQPIQLEEWRALIHHHAALGRPRDREALGRIAADESLDRGIRDRAGEALTKAADEGAPKGAD